MHMLQCMSPLLAQSGHPSVVRQCPLLGVKRTLFGAIAEIEIRRRALSPFIVVER